MTIPFAKIGRYSLWNSVVDIFINANCLIVADEKTFRDFLKKTDTVTFTQWLDDLMAASNKEPIDIVLTNEDFVESEKPFHHDLMKGFVSGMNEKTDGTTYCKNVFTILSNMTKHVRDSIIKYDVEKVHTISPEMYEEFLQLAKKSGGKKKTTRKARKANTRHFRRVSRHGYFPTGAIVAYQQEPYSAKVLANINNSFQNENVFPRFSI